jgi:hypothetical protein
MLYIKVERANSRRERGNFGLRPWISVCALTWLPRSLVAHLDRCLHVKSAHCGTSRKSHVWRSESQRAKGRPRLPCIRCRAEYRLLQNTLRKKTLCSSAEDTRCRLRRCSSKVLLLLSWPRTTTLGSVLRARCNRVQGGNSCRAQKVGGTGREHPGDPRKGDRGTIDMSLRSNQWNFLHH